jgi:integrase
MAKRAANGTGCIFQPTYTDKGRLKTSSTWWMKLPDGTKEKCLGATNEREARVCLQKRLGMAAMGTAPKAGEKHLCYGELRELVILDMQVKKLRSLERLSNGNLTVKGLTKLDEYFHWTPESAGDRVTDYDPADWESNFILTRRQEGVSDATIINSAKLLRKIFSVAVHKGRMTVAPKVAVPKAPEAKEHVLYKEQFDRLLTYANKKFIPLLTFLFYQGTRTAEALNLKWEQIDLGPCVYHPNPKFNKTNDSEQKTLHQAVVEVLGEAGDEDAYVFQSVRAEGKNVRKRVEKMFRAAMLDLKFGGQTWECAQCKGTKKGSVPVADSPAIECPNCKGVPMQFKYVGPSPHSLRASCVVFYLESGMSETEVMKVTGHSDIDVFRGYARLSNENLRQSMNAAGAMREQRMKALKRASGNRKPALVA